MVENPNYKTPCQNNKFVVYYKCIRSAPKFWGPATGKFRCPIREDNVSYFNGKKTFNLSIARGFFEYINRRTIFRGLKYGK